jgi:hypothetical protein
MEEAESLLGPCACVLAATVDAGPVRRAYPETLRRIINADVIFAGPGDLDAVVVPTLNVGGMAATLSAVNAVRILVVTEEAFHLTGLRAAALAASFDHVLTDPHDPHALALAVLRLAHAGRPPLAPCAAPSDFSLTHATAIGPIIDLPLALSRLHHD